MIKRDAKWLSDILLSLSQLRQPVEGRVQFKRRTLKQVAELICGNHDINEKPFFVYRSSSYLTEFFEDIETDYTHDGSTRAVWVADTLEQILTEPQPAPNTPPDTFARVIRRLMDQEDATNESPDRPRALEMLNAALKREGFEAFYGQDSRCYLRHIATQTVASPGPDPHRPFTPQELKRREQLISYLDKASEDELIEEVLLPLFRQLGFHRITAAGHKDKALEYGKDVWMKYTLPTQHVLYFGIQAKKGKLDSSGRTEKGNANVAEVHNQALMLLGCEIFDPEIGKKVLVDHVFIVAGGEITKAARNWLAHKLDASQRRSIIFMDRNDILNLFVVTNLPLPSAAWPAVRRYSDEPPF
jgi:hypothetical protein